MSKDVLSSAQGKENKSLHMSQLNTVNQQHDEKHRHSKVITSGISSVRRSLDKLATSISDTNITTDDGEEVFQKKNSFNNEGYEKRRCDSDASSITKTSSECHLSSTTTTTTSSQSSGVDMVNSSLSMLAISSKQSLIKPLIHGKSKRSVGNFFRKIFRSSSNSSHNQRSTSLDLIHDTAYPPMRTLPVTQGPIRLFVLRHGERLDRYYSSQWLQQAFDSDGNFCRFSPILPETIPVRASNLDFDLDPPLTYKGLKDAYQTGATLKEKNLHIHHCYSSPALRCVQTAAKILEGLELHNKMKIRIEPGLFECTAWYTQNGTDNVLTMPKFMTKKELLENKYPIDKTYHEQMNIVDISQLENELEYYERSHVVAASILKMHENEFITQIQQGQISSQHHIHILFIAHAPSLETCTRKLCGGKFRPDLLGYVIRNVDFLTMTVIEKTDNNCDKWIFRRSSFYGEQF